MTSVLLASLALTSAVAAQRTWIVDPTGAGDFTDIPEAFAAVASGDSLLARPGFYRGASTSKGIRVYAVDRFLAPYGVVEVHDLPYPETFVIDSFGSNGAGTQLLFRDCRGTIHVGPFEQTYSLKASLTPARVTIEDCDNVVFHHCRLYDVRIKNSTVLFSDCVFFGLAIPYPIGTFGSPALQCEDSHVTIVQGILDGSLTQQTTSTVPTPPAGIEMRGGTLILAGESPCSWIDGGATSTWTSGWVLGAAIHSDGGHVVLDPRIAINPRNGPTAPTIVGSSTIERRAQTYVMTQHAIQGNSFRPEVWGPPTAAFGLLASLDSRRVPTFLGDLWLDPATILPIGSGSLASGRVTFDVPVGNGLFPLGTAFTFQALVLDGPRLDLSSPVIARINALPFLWPKWSSCP